MINRRRVLKGVGGVFLGLPLLESFPKGAKAAATDQPFVIFLRQANGVACAQSSDIGAEPERFWPTAAGALSAQTVSGRAIDQLSMYLKRLLITKVNTRDYKFDCGHARGAFQGLTGNGPLVEGADANSEARSESIDYRVGRELNVGGREALFLYAGQPNGFLGMSMSHALGGKGRTGISNPWTAYQSVTGGAMPAGLTTSTLGPRQKGVNDFVRTELQTLLANPSLSSSDRRRLDLHLSSVRDLELNLACALAADQAKVIETGSGIFESNDGTDRIATVKLHLDVAALAVTCGQTRSVALQVGSGNDPTQYRDPVTNKQYENYHFISHRVQTDDLQGPLIAGSDVQHHNIDCYFAQMFKHLLDRLDANPLPTGGTMLDAGLSVWYNELGNGPGHSPKNVPYIIAGSAFGKLKQGQYIESISNDSTHVRLLRAIAVAAGVTTPLDDFGDPISDKGYLTELFV